MYFFKERKGSILSKLGQIRLRHLGFIYYIHLWKMQLHNRFIYVYEEYTEFQICISN